MFFDHYAAWYEQLPGMMEIYYDKVLEQSGMLSILFFPHFFSFKFFSVFEVF